MCFPRQKKNTSVYCIIWLLWYSVFFFFIASFPSLLFKALTEAELLGPWEAAARPELLNELLFSIISNTLHLAPCVFVFEPSSVQNFHCITSFFFVYKMSFLLV